MSPGEVKAALLLHLQASYPHRVPFRALPVEAEDASDALVLAVLRSMVAEGLIEAQDTGTQWEEKDHEFRLTAKGLALGESLVFRPELYEMLSKPRPADIARGSVLAFLHEVTKLRIQYKIPELLVICAAVGEPEQPGGKPQHFLGATHRGSSEVLPHILDAGLREIMGTYGFPMPPKRGEPEAPAAEGGAL